MLPKSITNLRFGVRGPIFSILGGFLRSLIFDDVFYTFLERPSPRNADFPSRRVFTDPQGGARGEPPGSQGGLPGKFGACTGGVWGGYCL